MKQKYMSILVIFNILIFSIITVFSGIMLFRASYAASNNTVWDGTIGTSFAGGSGTSSSPYLISNGKQLAYFIKKCNESASYRGKYYKLTADITLNDGYFDYKNEFEYYYYKDNTKYFITKNKYYDSDGHLVGTFNQLPISNFNFNGNFNGDSHIISGLFYYDETYRDYFGFFSNISNSTVSLVKNFKVINASITAKAEFLGFIGKFDDSNLEKVLFSGLIKNMSDSTNIGYSRISGNTIYLNSNNYNGNFELSGIASEPFTYLGINYNAGRFNISFKENQTSVTLQGTNNLQLSDINYIVYHDYNNTGFIGYCGKGTIDSISVSGNIVGTYGDVAGLIGRCTYSNTNASATANTIIKRSYSRANIFGKNKAGGIIGQISDSSTIKHNVYLTNVYNEGKISRQTTVGEMENYNNTGGLIATVSGVNKIIFSNCINNSQSSLDGQFIGFFNQFSSNYVSSTKSYYTNSGAKVIGNYSGGISGISYKNFSDLNYTSMNYLAQSAGTSVDNVWILESGKMPYLYFDELESPNINISINVSGNSYSWNNSNSSLLGILYDYDDERIVNVSVEDDNEIVYIEYYVDDVYRLNPYIGEMSAYDLGPIDISSYTCATVYIRAIDIYGNERTSYSDLIVSDNYKTDTYVDSEGNDTINVDKACLSDSIFNISFKREFYKDTDANIYSRINRIYLKLVNQLPIGTEIILYDKITNYNYIYIVNENTNYLEYTDASNNRNYYMLSLADFHKLNNNEDFFDNLVSSYESSNLFSFNIKMSFKFPYDLGGNDTYKFSDEVAYSALVDYYNIVVNESQKIENIIASASEYNPSCSYNLLSSINPSYSLNTNTIGSILLHELYIYKMSTNRSIDGVSYNIVSKRDGYKNLNLTVEVLDFNGDSLASTVGNNFEFILSYNGGEKSFNTKSNSLSSIDISDLPSFNTIGSVYLKYSIKVKLLSRNFRNIIPGDYRLRLSLYSSDGLLSTEDLFFTLDSPKVFSGYSFNSNVSNGERVIDHVTGHNNLDNNVLHYNYRYSLYGGTKQYLLFKLYKIDGIIGSTRTVDSTEIFTSSTLTSLEDNGYYKLGNNACIKDTNCNYLFYFKENLPTGNYYAEVLLMRESTVLSRDHFNFIVK